MADASSADPGISATGGREDILALWLGLLVFLLALPSAAGLDLVGWVVTTSVWTDPAKALAPASRTYDFLGGAGALLATVPVRTTPLTQRLPLEIQSPISILFPASTSDGASTRQPPRLMLETLPQKGLSEPSTFSSTATKHFMRG